MKYTVVTTFAPKHVDAYALQFVRTFTKLWPKDVSLIVYCEGKPDPRMPDGPEYRNLLRLPNFAAFQERHKRIPSHRGLECIRGMRWKASDIKVGYSFKYDAVRFSHKVYAIGDAAERLPKGGMFWLDADVKTFDFVPLDLLGRMLPHGYSVSRLWRESHYSECGFVGYNMEAGGSDIAVALRDEYDSDRVFNMSEWHDSFVFDRIIERLRAKVYNIPHQSRRHPFINSELGRYCDHMKGTERKTRGRSWSSEQKAHKDVFYWQ